MTDIDKLKLIYKLLDETYPDLQKNRHRIRVSEAMVLTNELINEEISKNTDEKEKREEAYYQTLKDVNDKNLRITKPVNSKKKLWNILLENCSNKDDSVLDIATKVLIAIFILSASFSISFFLL